MFNLARIQDTIPIEPADFRKPSRQAIEDEINEKYANRIIQKVGLAICMYDIISASDAVVDNESGNAVSEVVFRILVFRPFQGEIIEGKVGDSTPKGIRIQLEFFNDIHVPGPNNLFSDAKFEPPESTWIWTADSTPYYFDKGERVRLRVEDEIWRETGPESQPQQQQQQLQSQQQGQPPSASARGVAGGPGAAAREATGGAAWRIVASMSQGGLGLLSWW